MTTTTPPLDDIIELTDVVEEGIPLDADFDDFPMEQAIDTKSLDQELDDLLRDASSSPKTAQKDSGALDFEAMYTAAQDVPSKPAAQAPQPPSMDTGLDFADLDDLFDSLHNGAVNDEQTALDDMLDGDAPSTSKPEMPAPAILSDVRDMSLELPGIVAESELPDVLDLTEEVLADLPETLLAPSVVSEKPAADFLAAPENLGLELPPLLGTPTAEDTSSRHSQIFSGTIETSRHSGQGVEVAKPVDGVTQAELEILSTRLDRLEARPEPVLELQPESVLALLPDTTETLPFAKALREEIRNDVESRTSFLASLASVEKLRQSVDALQQRFDALPEPQSAAPSAPLAERLQTVETELDTLRTLTQVQEQSLLQMQESLTAKDTTIASLLEREEAMRQELSNLSSRALAASDLEALRAELRGFIQTEVPAAAAKVIREEIQALLKEMGS